ncbi:aspartate-semialdehyde dehydrogenase [Ichthyobacterium seriolicida]|uniref:Aspartate-semialdehyde dehydrogenase n=1 Tax=Ichthyobacterium seriolicida TaxID=242600 RepID=A0A1J1E2P4_9FLAO|nr:aspartate-semialdehyde dehydrogenase [Ichthyobacterium seriolicida]BAV95221.1 aspartate-semialdehyde dehydrogenase [Ichthyobacterium seriolicida]
MKLVIVGATGLVGRIIFKLLQERDFPLEELFLVASKKSLGKEFYFKGKPTKVIDIEEALHLRPDIAIFSAGGDLSLIWAPKFSEIGTTVIDNSSAWRRDPTKKLIVPEINASELSREDKIISNPNCSTIQMVMVLNPLHQKYRIKRVVISTYQSVTGTGIRGISQLEDEEKSNFNSEKVYPHQIYRNVIPHCDDFEDNAYTKEEMKLIRETKKILGDDTINLTATAVRIPVTGGHSESINIEFENDFDIDELTALLKDTNGVIVQDDILNNKYPMPICANDNDNVFVGRIRRDHSREKALNLWIVSDNLRKGAATNTVQIAEYLVKNKLI